jgi:peptidoglycan/xylan/chitin deacetylase (PgdA/CDA1 family)
MLEARRRIVLTLFATILCACSPSTTAPRTPNASPAPATSPAASPTPQPTNDQQPTASGQPATVVYRGNASRRMVALTFDAGSDAGSTAEILGILRREGIRATFSVTGLWAEQNRDLLLAIAAAGHEIINHSYDHASFTGASTGAAPLTPDQRALELSRTEVTVYHLSQRSTRPYFRPPYGDIDDSVRRDAAADGYGTIVMWTVDTLGWNHATADAIVDRALSNAEPGAIYVMHVGSESQDAAALPRIIDGLRAQGYAFGAIEDVLAP